MAGTGSAAHPAAAADVSAAPGAIGVVGMTGVVGSGTMTGGTTGVAGEGGTDLVPCTCGGGGSGRVQCVGWCCCWDISTQQLLCPTEYAPRERVRVEGLVCQVSSSTGAGVGWLDLVAAGAVKQRVANVSRGV